MNRRVGRLGRGVAAASGGESDHEHERSRHAWPQSKYGATAETTGTCTCTRSAAQVRRGRCAVARRTGGTPLAVSGSMRSMLAVLVVVAACATGTDRVTWYRDVAPIAARHCMACHQPGGIGPFDLTDYAVAVAHATPMLDAIRGGVMPPFDAREEPACTPRFGWVDDPRLSADELATLEKWVADGTPAGDRAPLPAIASTELAGVTTTVVAAEPFTASGANDQFMCYLLDPAHATDTWLTGLQVRPGNARVVHHVVVSELLAGPAQDALVAEHGLGRPWACGPAPPGVVINVWTPGNQPFQTASEVAIPLLAGAKLALGIHYHPAGETAAPDATAIDLRASPVRPQKMYFVGGFGNAAAAPALLVDPDDRVPGTPEFRIPANTAAHGEHMRVTVTLPGNLPEVKLLGVDPHMHMLGTHIAMTVERPAPRGSDPQTECLANGRWNFDWQRSYFYDAPLDQLPSLRPGDVIDIACRWDNTLANPFVQRALADAGLGAPVDVVLGQGSLDEMCLEFLGMVVDLPPP